MSRIRTTTLDKLRQRAGQDELTKKDLARIDNLRHATKIRPKPETEEEKLMLEFIERVKELRKAADMTVTQFAAACGCSPSFISQLEGGYKSGITLKTAMMLAKGLGLELELRLK